MKKRISALQIVAVSSLLALTLASCNETASKDTEEFSGLEFENGSILVNMPVYNNLEDLEDDSAVIVVGTFTGETEQQEAYVYESAFGKDILSFVMSQKDVEVSQVIKGDVKAGDKITVTQYYGVVDDKFWTDSKLTPMLEGDTWLFFLSENRSDDGGYHCTSDNYGRYPLKNQSYKKIAFTDNEDLGVYDSKDFQESIYNEILEKYDF